MRIERVARESLCVVARARRGGVLERASDKREQVKRCSSVIERKRDLSEAKAEQERGKEDQASVFERAASASERKKQRER